MTKTITTYPESSSRARRRRNRVLLGTISTITLSVMALPAAAQQSGVLEELVVTAQKREQSLQDVSAAVSAVGMDRLQTGHINNIEDLQFIVPSITLGNDFNMAKLFIRGVGANTSTTGSETGVAFHVDGAFVSRAEAQRTSLFDLQRVEVVRGPQGSLYGRNAVGGSVNLITAKPTQDYEGYGNITFGNYSTLITEGAVSGPLSDTVLARAAFKTENRGGFGKNPVTGNSVDDVNRRMARLQVRFLPTDTFDYLVSAEWFHQDDASSALKYRAASFPDAVELGDTGVIALGMGGYASDPRDLASEFDPRNRTTTWAITGTGTWDVTSDLTLTNITNYRDFKSFITQDLDLSAVINSLDTLGTPTTVQRRDVVSQQFSNELRANYTKAWLDGVLGTFFFTENQRPVDTVGLGPILGMEQNLDVLANGLVIQNPGPNQIVGAPAPSLDLYHDLCQTYRYSDNFRDTDTLPPKRVCTRSDLDTTAWAVFGQANIHLGQFVDSLAGVSLKLGGRYSWEKREVANPSIVLAGGGTGPVLYYDYESTHNQRTFKDFTPEAGLEWAVNGDLLLYYTYSEGFKAGAGENASGSSTIVEPEKIKNHEAGIKSDWFGNRLSVNLAAFTYNLKGLQINKTLAGGPTGYTTVFENAAETSAKGVELEFAAQPLPAVRLNGALSYLDSKFDDFLTKDPLDPRNISVSDRYDPTLPELQLAGNPTRNSPKWAGNLHAEWDLPVTMPASGFLTLAGDASYKSKIYFTEFHRLLEGSDDYVTFDASLRYSSGDSGLTAELWVKNLTDELVESSTFALATARLIGVTYLPPRTYGFTLGYRF